MSLHSPSDVRRQAERYIEQHAAAYAGRVQTLWQKADEDADVFRGRCVLARSRLHHTQLLVVVCGPQVIERTRGIVPVEMPQKMLSLFDAPARYRVCYGGRGGARSWSFARALIVRSLASRIRILCCREYQNSIADSVHTLLSDQIEMLGLGHFFEVQQAGIFSRSGSEFIFSGIRTNVTRIKSLELKGEAVCFVEEAESITDTSWEVLIPTVRQSGSEIWAAFNPDQASDPTYERFVTHPPDNALVLKTTYADNPWFPAPLEDEREYLRRVDDDAYRHVWLGECRQRSEAQIFKGKYTVESFTPEANFDGPYFGLDLGFAADPSVLTKCWIADNRLYVEKEAWGLHVDTDRLPSLCDPILPSRHVVIRVDSSRPETVSYLRGHGFPNTESVEKWKDSVQDGIARMRAFEQIIIHPSCTHCIEEFRLYSYKTDRLTKDVLPDVLDKNNHCIDSIRYGIAPYIKACGAGEFLSWLASDVKREQQKAAVQTLTGTAYDRAKQQGAIVTPLGGAP